MKAAPDPGRFLAAPRRTFLALSVPVLFSLIAEPLTGLADTAFVSRLGPEALAALGVGTMVLSSLFWVFNFLSIGTQTEISQALGRQEHHRLMGIASLAGILGLFFGVLLMAVVGPLAPALASLMGAVGEVHDQARLYIQIRCVGAPAVLLTIASFGALYGLQDMRTPFQVAAVVNGLNIVLDAVLITGMGPIPPLGISGAAAASAASQWVGAFWCGLIIARRLGVTVRIRIADVRKVMRVGVDLFVRTGLLTAFLLLATRAATLIGSDAGAAHQVIRQVWTFAAFFLDAAAITAQSLVGYFAGANRVDEARRVAGFVCRWGVAAGAVLGCVMILGHRTVAAWLVPTSAQAVFTPAWMMAAAFQPVSALSFMTDGIHWGTGDYGFLRNAVVLATLCGAAGLFLPGQGVTGDLTWIWAVTGFWIAIRAVLGVIRIWPGIGRAPLAP